MKIALLSDTHSYLDNSVLKVCKGADEIWHAGDIGDLKVTDQLGRIAPVRAVYGNIDNSKIRATWPEHLRFTVNGLDVWITHIGGYPPRYNREIRPLIQANPPGLFICGHSHILKVMRDEKLGLLHMNPGAIGKQGFHKKRTMLRFQVKAGKVEELELIEYPRS